MTSRIIPVIILIFKLLKQFTIEMFYDTLSNYLAYPRATCIMVQMKHCSSMDITIWDLLKNQKVKGEIVIANCKFIKRQIMMEPFVDT